MDTFHSSPPWSCSRRVTGNTKCARRGRLQTSPGRKKPPRNATRRGKSGVLRFRPRVAANGEGNDGDLVHVWRRMGKKPEDDGVTKVEQKHQKKKLNRLSSLLQDMPLPADEETETASGSGTSSSAPRSSSPSAEEPLKPKGQIPADDQTCPSIYKWTVEQ